MTQLYRSLVMNLLVVASGVLTAMPAHAQTEGVDTVSAETYVTNWQGQCISKTRSDVALCHVEQAIHLRENKQQLVRVRVQTANKGSTPTLVLHLPFGIYLAYGLDVQFDDGKTRKHNIDTCDPAGCFVFIDVGGPMVANMKSGQEIKLRFQNLDRSNIDVMMPLSGFSKAMSGIE